MLLLGEIRNRIGNYRVKSGVYHYYRNEFKQAVEFLDRALGEGPELGDADRRRARHYLTLALIDSAAREERRGRSEEALGLLHRAAAVSPPYPDVQFRLGRLLEQLGQATAAIEAYERAVERHPGYLEAQVALGFARLARGATELARAAFERAMAIRRRQLEDPFEEALHRLDEGTHAEAAECLRRVFLATPRFAEEQMQRGLDELRAGHAEAALQHFDQALAAHPNYPDLHNDRGIALCELGRLDEAVDAFRLSARLSPGYLVPLLNLAFTRIRAGARREAMLELQAILEQDPEEPLARAALDELTRTRKTERRPVAPSRGALR